MDCVASVNFCSLPYIEDSYTCHSHPLLYARLYYYFVLLCMKIKEMSSNCIEARSKNCKNTCTKISSYLYNINYVFYIFYSSQQHSINSSHDRRSLLVLYNMFYYGRHKVCMPSSWSMPLTTFLNTSVNKSCCLLNYYFRQPAWPICYQWRTSWRVVAWINYFPFSMVSKTSYDLCTLWLMYTWHLISCESGVLYGVACVIQLNNVFAGNSLV